jgi:hypothetical protein
MSAFFGLTPKYRNILFTQLHDLVCHGGGGFIHSEVYNMPVWMRKFHIGKINEFNKKQKAEMDKQQGQSNIGDNQLSRPNINPSSTYNINK